MAPRSAKTSKKKEKNPVQSDSDMEWVEEVADALFEEALRPSPSMKARKSALLPSPSAQKGKSTLLPSPSVQKGKAKVPDFPSPPELTPIEQRQYWAKWRQQPKEILVERVFPHFYPAFPRSIVNTIANMKWEKFCHHRDQAVIPLVKEFYSDIDEKVGCCAEVQGMVVIASADYINSFFHLPSVEVAVINRMIENPTNEQLQATVKLLTGGVVDWDISKGGARTIPTAYLTPVARAWGVFVKRNILPTAHDGTLSQDRALLVYGILEQLPIDVGEIISTEIIKCSKRDKGKLFYPNLITMLCLEAGVSVPKEGECKDPISMGAHLNLCSKKKRCATPPSNPSSSDSVSLAEIKKGMDKLKWWCEKSEAANKAYWHYAQMRDAQVAHAFKDIGASDPWMPPFPESILDDWDIDIPTYADLEDMQSDADGST